MDSGSVPYLGIYLGKAGLVGMCEYWTLRDIDIQ